MAKKTVRRGPGREWIGGRCRFPAYIENPEPVRPDMIMWMDQESRFVFVMEAVLPETPDSALLEHFHQALHHPRGADAGNRQSDPAVHRRRESRCEAKLLRLVPRLGGRGALAPASARESVVVETLPGNRVVTVALPLPDLFGLRATKDTAPPS